MQKPRKPTANAIAFQREIERLQDTVSFLRSKGIEFLTSPIPEMPKRVTAKRLETVRAIDINSLLSAARTTKPDELPSQFRKPAQDYFPKGRKKAGVNNDTNDTRPIYTISSAKYSPEELHKIRVEAGRKAAAKLHEREQTDALFKKKMDEIRRKNLEKAREAQKKLRETGKQEVEKPAQPTPPPPTPTPPNIPDILDMFIDEINARIDEIGGNAAVYIHSIFDNELATYGGQNVMERANKLPVNVVGIISGTDVPASYDDKVKSNLTKASHLLYIILGTQPPFDMLKEIADLLETDSETWFEPK